MRRRNTEKEKCMLKCTESNFSDRKTKMDENDSTKSA